MMRFNWPPSALYLYRPSGAGGRGRPCLPSKPQPESAIIPLPGGGRMLTQAHTHRRNPGAPQPYRPLVAAGPRRNSPLAAFVLLALAILTAAPAAAQPAPTLLWSAHGVENVVSLTSIRDIDGDGGPDVVFESYDAGPSGVNHLFAIRGRSSGTGVVLWAARPLGGPSN